MRLKDENGHFGELKYKKISLIKPIKLVHAVKIMSIIPEHHTLHTELLVLCPVSH